MGKLNEIDLKKVAGGVIGTNEETVRSLVKSFIEKKEFSKIVAYYDANPQFKTIIDEVLSAAGYSIKNGKVVDNYLG